MVAGQEVIVNDSEQVLDGALQDQSIQGAAVVAQTAEELVELDASAEPVVDEKFQQLMRELVAAGKKIIKKDEISVAATREISDVLELLATLRVDVMAKKEEALAKSAFIKQRVQALIDSGKVHIQQEEYEKSEESVQQYAQLLDSVIAEIEGELLVFKDFLNAEIEYAFAYLHESNNFDQFLKNRIAFVRKYVKNIRKDLNVSYSRYSFGFEAQMKRILNVENFVRYQASQEAAAHQAAITKTAAVAAE